MRNDCNLLKSKRKGKQVDGEASIASQSDDGVTLTIACMVSSSVDTWVLDSGASFHICPDRSFFSTYKGVDGNVYLGNDRACKILGIGDVVIEQANGKKHTLTNVRHVPEITKNLISAGQLDEAGYVVTFGNGLWKISKGCMTVLKGQKDGSLYTFLGSPQRCMSTTANGHNDMHVWYGRLGHLSEHG